MPPNQGSGNYGSQMATRVPARVKGASKAYAKKLHGVDAYVDVSQSHLLRWGLYQLLLDRWEELPTDVRDDLDREFLEREVEQMPSLSEGSS